MGHSWVDSVVTRVIGRAARNLPETLSARLQEEWLAHMVMRPGPISRFSFAVECYWAATLIGHDHSIGTAAVASAPAWERSMTAYAQYKSPLYPRRPASAAQSSVLCDINITPLIDVMLVLLVTLIVTLPITTHAVKLELPRPPTSRVDRAPPEVVDLDIDFDGTVAWNGKTLASFEQLESYLRVASRKVPQPEMHLRADRGVKYDYVAKVLAAAQRNRLRRVGFANTADFKN
jgi:biopolymer transport protein ExbD